MQVPKRQWQEINPGRRSEVENKHRQQGGLAADPIIKSRSIDGLERHKIPHMPDHGLAPWKTGNEMIDACLPEHGLGRTGLHEIEPLRPANMPSLTGFVFGLVSRLQSSQPVIWCVTAQQVGDYGHLYAFGLERYGISPAQVVFAKVSHPLHLHFALEEALKTDGIAAVIGEGQRPDFTGSRRLSLLSKKHQTPCLLMSPQSNRGRGSAALTRWQVASTQGVEDPLDPFGPGLPTWLVALSRIRGGQAMPEMEQKSEHQNRHNTSYPWRVVWDEQTLSFRSAAVFSNGAFS